MSARKRRHRRLQPLPGTLDGLFLAWKNQVASVGGPVTAGHHRAALRRALDWVTPDGVRLGARQLATLNEARLEAYRASNAVGKEVVHLRRLLNFAVARGELPSNPMRSLQLPIWSPRVKVSAPRLLRPDAPRQQSLRRLSLAERIEVAEIEKELKAEGNCSEFPRTRGECPPAAEPCPWARCRHHLAVDVAPNRYAGGRAPSLVKLTFPGRDVDQIQETCSLRVAEGVEQREMADPRGPVRSRDEVGRFMNLSIELIHQLEKLALKKLRAGLRAHSDAA